MRGFPKYINSRRDIENLTATYPSKTKEWLERGFENHEGWLVERKLGPKEDGITDSVSRVVNVKTGVVEEKYQERYRALPGNRLVRIGLSQEDTQKVIEDMSERTRRGRRYDRQQFE